MEEKCIGRTNCTIKASNDNDFLMSGTFETWRFETDWKYMSSDPCVDDFDTSNQKDVTYC